MRKHWGRWLACLGLCLGLMLGTVPHTHAVVTEQKPNWKAYHLDEWAGVIQILETEIVPQAVTKLVELFPKSFGYLDGSSIGMGLTVVDRDDDNAHAAVKMTPRYDTENPRDVELGYELWVNLAPLGMSSAYGWELGTAARKNLESTIVHEMLHALMIEAMTSGMAHLNEDMRDVVGFPEWFREGVAQAVGGGADYARNRLKIDGSSSEAEITAVLGGTHKLGEDTNFSKYCTGYLAVLYLGSLIGNGESEAQVAQGLDILLKDIKDGKSLDKAIRENSTYTGLDGFVSHFPQDGASFVKRFFQAVENEDSTVGLGALITKDYQEIDLLANTALEQPLFQLCTTHNIVWNVYPADYLVMSGGRAYEDGLPCPGDEITLTSDMVQDIAPQTYTGEAIEPVVTVTDNGKLLKQDTDYTVIYTENTNAGTATVTITGRGGYTGTVTKTFTIAPKVVANPTITLVQIRYTYTGSPHTPAVQSVQDGETLIPASEYTVQYENNTNVGQATVCIEDKEGGNYTVSGTTTFTIDKTAQKPLAITKPKTVTYGDSFTLTATGGSGEGAVTWVVTEGNDSAVIEPDTGKVTVTGVGSVTITATKAGGNDYANATTQWTFTAARKNIGTLSISLVDDAHAYTGQAITPVVTVRDGEKELIQSGEVAAGDYTVVYANHTKVGKATVTVTGIGNYTGTKTLSFTITKATIKAEMVGTIADQTYTGRAITPAVTITSGEKVLVLGEDYTVKYTNNTKAGEATVTITGKGNHGGTVTTKFTITPQTLSDDNTVLTLKPTSFVYDGKEKKPAVTVKAGTQTLKVNTDYTVEYADNTNVGTATITVTGQGNYEGIVTTEFQITKLKQKALTISGQPKTAPIYGDSFTLTAAGGSSGEEVTWAVTEGVSVATVVQDTGHVTITGVGKVTITATRAGGDNYEDVTATWTFTAQTKVVTATVAVEDKDFDGTTTATIAVAVTEGLVNGDTLTIKGVTGSFVSAEVGRNKPVLVHTTQATAEGAKKDCYEIVIPARAIASIHEKAPLLFEQSYLVLKVGEPFTFAIRDGDATWKQSNESEAVVRISGNTITAQKVGTTFITLTRIVDGVTHMARCRVDVVEDSKPLDAHLLTTTATVNVYSGQPVPVYFQLALEQNGFQTDSGVGVVPNEGVEAGAVGYDITAASFVQANGEPCEELNQLFTLRVADNRIVEILPAAHVDWANAAVVKALKASYQTKLSIIINGEPHMMVDTLTLKVDKKLPTVKAGAMKLNTFGGDATAPLGLTSSNGTVLAAVVDENKATAKAPAIPNGLTLNSDMTVTVRQGTKASGKLNLLVYVDGYSVPVAVSVSVSAAPTAPTLKLGKTSGTLNPVLGAGNDSFATPITATPTDYELDAVVVEVLDGKTQANDELTIDYQDGMLTVFTNDSTGYGKAYKLSIYPGAKDASKSDAPIEKLEGAKAVTLTIKTPANEEKAQPTLTITAKGSIDVLLGTGAITLTPKYTNYTGVGDPAPALSVKAVDPKNKEDVGIEVGEDGFDLSYDNGMYTLTAKPAVQLDTSKTYNLTLTVTLGDQQVTSKPVKLTLTAKAPTLKLGKTSATLNHALGVGLDVFATPLTVTPADYALTEDSVSIRVVDGKNLNTDGQLDVELQDGILTVVTTDSTQLNATYKVTVTPNVDGAKAVTLTVKTTDKAPTVTVTTKGTIDTTKALGSSQPIILTPKFTNYNGAGGVDASYTVTAVNPKDKAAGPETVSEQFDLADEGGSYILTAGTDAKLDPALTYKVTLTFTFGKGDGAKTATAKPVNLTIKQGTVKVAQSVKAVELLANDRYSEGIVELTLSDKTLSPIGLVVVQGADKSDFDVTDLSGGRWAIGFKDDTLPENVKGGTIKLDVYLTSNLDDQNEPIGKANATVSITVKVVQPGGR